MFSIVIPLYNKELSILNTIQSVLVQTYQEFEVIVINDGSTDNSVKVVENIDDNRIKLIHQKNQGVSIARNCGIEEAKYEWIAFLDGDDLWEVNHLEEIEKMMQKFPDEKVYVTSFKYSDKRPMFKYPRKNSIFKIENYFKQAIKENLIWTSIIVIHKECFDKVGCFNPNLDHGEDLDLWARLAREYSVIKSSIVTAVYRLEAENRACETSSFNVYTSSVYYYDLTQPLTTDEFNYYMNKLIQTCRTLIYNRDIKNFLILYKKHFPHISLMIILKVRKLSF